MPSRDVDGGLVLRDSVDGKELASEEDGRSRGGDPVFPDPLYPASAGVWKCGKEDPHFLSRY